ncbi:hypothetical protein C475_22149 [Halosimplex carlsbadense 2-9-1]|uniref:Uncharacterized protein n=1 Tax=Halosimplex carlsbadense 2-9-1 TaxID=797114 RepID=M0CAP9_9EURY|nr:hypothetical protein C475_22149 [Halosimplex carlsbadense 2-9-1]
MDERLRGGRQAVLLEDGDFLLDEVPNLHTAECSQSIDDRIADARDVLLEAIAPGVAVHGFQFDSLDQ